MVNVNDMTVREICAEGELSKYREEVRIAIELAHERGFAVCSRYDSPQSSIEWGEEGRDKRIRLALAKGAEKGVSLIWDLLHEIGHIDQGCPSPDLPPDEKFRREKDAWSIAWKIAEAHLPSLTCFRRKFETHRDKCLATYRNAREAKERNTNNRM